MSEVNTIREGYKESALGEIPEGWEVYQLSKHIELLTGFPFKSQNFNEDNRGTKLLRGVNITEGKLRWNEKIDRWWNLPFDEFDKYSAHVGDLVISMDGSLVGRNYARVGDSDLPLLVVQRVACIRSKKSLDLEFLNQIIGSPLWVNYVDSVKTSSGIPHISAKNIREFKVPFPPLPEQQKIAEILSTVDDKIDVIDQQITQTQELKKGLMQQLLTKGIGHTRFKDSVLGEIPEGWEVKNIEDILTIGSGKDYKHLDEGEIPVYGTGGLMTYVNDYLYDGESVGIGRKGTIDKPVFLSGKFWTVDTLFFTHSFIKTLPKYVYYLFLTIDWKRHNEASGVPSLSKTTIEKIKLIISPLPEQQKIAEILSTVDDKIEVLQNKKSSFKEMKKGLMQQLLTGKTRVKL